MSEVASASLSSRQSQLAWSARESARYWTKYGDPRVHGVLEHAWLDMAERLECGELAYDEPFLLAAYDESDRLKRLYPDWGEHGLCPCGCNAEVPSGPSQAGRG